MHNTKFI